MKNICVFCGSMPGTNAAFRETAVAFATLLAQRGHTLVYGGGSVGLMGAIADAALAIGGKVIGVIPRTLFEREVGHRGLTENHIVETMHERKQLMSDLSDAFVALPGAVGTMDEFFETWTWAQLGVHNKPFGILNVAGYYTNLLAFLDTVVASGFMKQQYLDMVQVDTDGDALLRKLSTYQPPTTMKWVSDAQR
ncbi:MAG: TIGR00730 family Rossman fold protein [Phycisphaerae bacterium]